MSEEEKRRRSKKAAVTRIINKIKRYVAEEDKSEVKANTDVLIAKFKEFEVTHEHYNASLEADEEVEASDTYFYSVQDEYIATLNLAKDWLRGEADVTQNSSKVNSSLSSANQSDIMSAINLPKIELETFDGDPMKYHSFMMMFDEVVDSSITDDRLKMTRLMQYTGGKAKEAIRYCTLVEDGKGYSQAREVLQKRFGNAHLVTEHIMRGLRQGKPVRSPEELQQLSDDLSCGHTTLEQMGHLQEMESQACIIDIVSRLQPYLQIKWKKKALETKSSTAKYPSIADLVSFVKSQASDANDPVYGKIGQKVKQGSNVHDGKLKSSNSSLKTSTSFSSNVTESNVKWKRPPCVACGNDHKLLYCPVFKGMKPADRLQLVHLHKLCENCLLNNHNTEMCRRASMCGISGCNLKHTRFIHVVKNDVSASEAKCKGTDVINHQIVTDNVVNDAFIGIHIPIVTVKVNDCYDACALLDTASSSTFCTKQLVKSLGLCGRKTEYVLNTLSCSEERRSDVVSLRVSSVGGEESLYLPHVFVVDEIPVKALSVDVASYPYLRDLCLTESKGTVQILIGQDNAEALVPLEVIKGKKGEPFAVKTLFGWSLNGPANIVKPVKHHVVSHFITACSLDEKVNSLWAIENAGLSRDEPSWSQNDKRVIQLWDKECRKVDGRYEIPIPWKPHVQLSNNSFMAMSRLKSLQKNLAKRDLFSMYDQEIQRLLTHDYAEIIPLDEVHIPSQVWYLPHHAVVTDKKPGKIRVVFDCAAKFQGESLNSNCYQGPDLNNKLLEVLLRFRQHVFALMSDIEAMYNQVAVPVRDRNFLRFLWFDENGDVIHCRMTRHLFGGVWCSSAATYALRRTVFDSCDIDPIVVDTVLRSFYVDDCLKSVESRDKALTVIHGTKDLLFEASFRLTKFVVNDVELLQSIPENDCAQEVKELCFDSSSKALGIKWNVSSDTFYFDVVIELISILTRRKMLSFVASVFDPLGFVSPVVVTGKMLFQEATRLKLSWDTVVPLDLKRKWDKWLLDLSSLKKFQVLRCVKPPGFDDGTLELHHFSDASQKAYGCCSYLRCVSKTGQIHVALILSKCKLAPLKQITIPRLELQAAVLAARIDQTLKSQLDLDLAPSHFWVDSELVLKYIHNEDRRFQVFVGNRVGEIRQLTKTCQWHFIAGADNPADVISRGQTTCSWDVARWFQGPTFLWKYKSEWKVLEVDCSLDSNDPDLKVESCFVANTDNAVARIFGHYSSWYRLKRAVAWLLRWMELLKSKRSVKQKGPLSVGEIEKAEFVILGIAQRQCFVKEIQHLLKGEVVGKNSKVVTLDPFMDKDGLLRVGGRIRHANLNDCQKHPYLIPHDHPIAVLIVREYHNVAHVGNEWVIGQMRKRYWITKVRRIVKRIAHNCFVCKRFFTVPCVQKMACLPPERLEYGKPPFSYVGIDCFGPFPIKRGRAEEKRYGCIFTCLNTRAIHLEKLNSLDTDSFLNGFRRFVCRRGSPIKVWSDNGTNFVAGHSELSKGHAALNKVKIQSYGVQNNIEWHFNPPCASHMGGIWERMIRTVRKVLVGLCPVHVKLTDELLSTLFCEVEFIVNSRPITKVSDDVKDPCALTPNHLLLLREQPPLVPDVFGNTDLYKRRWRCVQHLADEFWYRWLREYLPLLQTRVKWTDSHKNVQVGDLVLIKDEKTPRGVWPIGLVREVFSGSDGLIRSAKVKTKATELVRPIVKIVILEGSK